MKSIYYVGVADRAKDYYMLHLVGTNKTIVEATAHALENGANRGGGNIANIYTGETIVEDDVFDFTNEDFKRWVQSK